MNSGISRRSVLTGLGLAVIGASRVFAQDRISVLHEKPVPASDVPADAITVEIDKMKYQTPEVTIEAGDTVYWINREVMPHNVAFKEGIVAEGAFRGEMLTKDQAYAITFTEAGSFDYFCTPHPFMRGKVIVG
ncbi:amicyanin [Paracoccus marinaquae]|uniref:Amicyanin n=1 Tax=Paracoccus marinaquae TaxID=2841926 RepID=A0ABS6AJF2_9RHOB|nr:amicyanin [Paracoccus marinaquae]MBU3030721.1 amicyanin [Paracoccus marinaquae]